MINKTITIALAGNPNSGKTTVFNNLTGTRQKVGNYPGVTVEKVEGTVRYKGYTFRIVDLPGTYSLTAHSQDEIVARNFVLEEKPDVVIDVVDSSNLERNLYLATQFIELGVPLILAFNMHDVAQRQGLTIDKNRLSQLLGVPIVFTVAIRNKGLKSLLDEAIKFCEGETIVREVSISYRDEIRQEINKLKKILLRDTELIARYHSNWFVTKLLEQDEEVFRRIPKGPFYDELLSQAKKSAQHLETLFGDIPEALIAEGRYGFISGACSEAVVRNFEARHSISDNIDKILINKVLGLPIFLFSIWLVFKFTFTLSEPLMKIIESAQKWLGDILSKSLVEGSALQSLVVNGIVEGVGSVVVFVPIIFLLFLALGFLEYSGYMARAAFIMDRFMHKIGLHGRSFIPMLLGFGCNVPAIMATRTIEDRKDRMVTLLVIPFMSCGARFPVYILFIGAFFPEKMAGNILFSLYLLGIGIAVCMAKIFRKYLFKGEAAPFVMELPPYRMPALKGLLIHTWERGAEYLKKAGTVIFAACVVMWFLSNFPWNPHYSKDYKTLIEEAQGDYIGIWELESEMSKEKIEKSYAGRIGKIISPVFKPLGFDDWRISVALIGGFIAKETVIGTMGTLHAIRGVEGEMESLRIKLQNAKKSDGEKLFNPLMAYSLMVFILLYVPCAPVVAIIRQETGSWLWALFAMGYTTSIAWIISFIIYQGGRLLGL